MAFSVCLVHEIMEQDEHRVTANTSAICQESVDAENVNFICAYLEIECAVVFLW